jgi:pimeloyl-ACP methyl ester carboxylesterase
MSKIQAGNIAMSYDQQGSGEPLVLIPYLAADYACYAFQVADYSKHFTCISVDPRGTGESDKPGGVYSTEMFADDVAALMQAIGIHKAHIFALSLGAATGMWLAAKYPDRVKSLSLHSGWPKSDAYLKTVVQSWQVLAKAITACRRCSSKGSSRASRPSCMRKNRITSRPCPTSCAAAPSNQSTHSSSSPMQ